MDVEEAKFLLGLLSMTGSVILFGSMFVPLRNKKCGDGIYVQFLMGIAIFFIGFIVHSFERFPPIYPVAMLGGISWAIANAAAIPIIKVLGIALAPLIWNITGCLMGWATSRYGLFGIKEVPPKSDLLNYSGLVLLLLGGIMFLFVKNSHQKFNKTVLPSTISPKEIEIPKYVVNVNKGGQQIISKPDKTVDRRRYLAVVACLICGIFYGQRTTPVIYIQDHRKEFSDASGDGIIYAFSHFLGIFITTTAIFVFYSLIKKGKPIIRTELTLPSFLSGGTWGVAMVLLFVSNDLLSQTIAFPIITVLPGFVAAIWSIVYFKEISGRKNLIIISIAFMITFCGAVIMAMSRRVILFQKMPIKTYQY